MVPGILQEPAPQVMVFIPQTRVLTIPRQSETERGMGWEREVTAEGGGGGGNHALNYSITGSIGGL